MASWVDDAAVWLEGRLGEMDDALASLVELNSFTENVAGGREVGRALRQLFAIGGLSEKVVRSERFADHLVFESQGNGRAPWALVGHLDTVFPPGKFEGYRKDGELRRGPAVLDMKGGLVVIAWALKALQAAGGLSRIPPVRVIIVADEEVGSPEGAGVIRAHAAGAEAALVFESGRANDAIVTRRKGTGFVTAVARGRAAHAGNAHPEGKNAIWALARFVDRAQALTDYARGVTTSVGTISGGQSKNTVPDLAEAGVDIRFCTHADGEDLIERLRRAAAEAARSVEGTSIALEGGISRDPLERSDASAALMRAYAEAAKASGLGAPEAPLLGGGSDASTTSSMGIPSIDGLGPRGKGFHTTDEQIEVQTLVSKAQALVRILGRYQA